MRAALRAAIALAGLVASTSSFAARPAQDGEPPKREPPEEAPEPPKVLYSGPQRGEKLLPLRVIGVSGDIVGKEVDFVGLAGIRPTLLVFVHKLTRPAIELTRTLTEYTVARPKDEDGEERVFVRIVWLADDRSKTLEYLKKAHVSIGFAAPIGLSVDGREGPGNYGLNRNVNMTVLVANEQRVTANFALLQPGSSNALDILTEVARTIGDKPPTEVELAKYRRGGMAAMMADADPHLFEQLQRLCASDLNAGQTKKLGRQIERYVGEDAKKRRDLGLLSAAVTSNPGFESVGTPTARELLRGWVRKYKPGQTPPGEDDGEDGEKDGEEGKDAPLLLRH